MQSHGKSKQESHIADWHAQAWTVGQGKEVESLAAENLIVCCTPSDIKLPSGPFSCLLKQKLLRKIHSWTFVLDLSQAIVYPLPINNIYNKALHAVKV